MLVDNEQPLRVCKHCQEVFLGKPDNMDFCSARCKEQSDIRKNRKERGWGRCGGVLYTFVLQTAKGWQPVLLGTNCQPFFVAYAAPQGHLVRQESRVDLHSAAVCCTKV